MLQDNHLFILCVSVVVVAVVVAVVVVVVVVVPRCVTNCYQIQSHSHQLLHKVRLRMRDSVFARRGSAYSRLADKGLASL
jgi:hypothetical protein